MVVQSDARKVAHVSLKEKLNSSEGVKYMLEVFLIIWFVVSSSAMPILVKVFFVWNFYFLLQVSLALLIVCMYYALAWVVVFLLYHIKVLTMFFCILTMSVLCQNHSGNSKLVNLKILDVWCYISADMGVIIINQSIIDYNLLQFFE